MLLRSIEVKSVVKVEEGPEYCSMPKAGLEVVSKKTLLSVEVEEPKAVVSKVRSGELNIANCGLVS